MCNCQERPLRGRPHEDLSALHRELTSIQQKASGSSPIDPNKGEPWAKIPRCGPEDVSRAVQAASRAMWKGPWAGTNPSARGKIMRRVGDLVAENATRLAEIEVRDNGKLFAEMLGQVRYHPEWWWYYAGLADKIEGAPDAHRQARHFCVYAARAGRGRGGADGLELPVALCCLEVRAGSCGRLLRCRQAV